MFQKVQRLANKGTHFNVRCCYPRLASIYRNKYCIGEYRFFSLGQQPRQRAKRQRVTPKKFTESVEESDDFWSWAGNNASKWSWNLVDFNIRLIIGTIFFLQVYTVYEYFKYGKIKWIRNVLKWLPNYMPQSLTNKLKELGERTQNEQNVDKDG